MVSTGDNLTDVLGSAPALAVSTFQNSSLVQGVQWTGAILNIVDKAFSPVEMSPGMPVSDAVGTNMEVAGRQGAFMDTVMGVLPGIAVMGAFALVEHNTSPAPTQEQIREANVAADAQRLAGIKEEDAKKAEAGLKEQQRIAFFQKKPPGR
jgi:hypothetical protein